MEPDDDVVGWSVHGDRNAFAMLVRRHSQAVHAYLTRRGGRQVADDLLTEVWLRAWRSRTSYDQNCPSARPWLYGIARHTLAAYWRSHARETSLMSALSAEPWPEVDDRLDAVRLRPALERALSALTAEHREILLLVAWEELTPAEAAVVLQLPQSTVRSRLLRARAALQQRYDRPLHPPLTTHSQKG